MRGERFLRSVRVDRDSTDNTALAGYVVTSQVRDVLVRLIDGAAGESLDRAWTLTGPYGTGKSAFALFLSHILCDPDPTCSRAWNILREQDLPLTEHVMKVIGGRRFLPLLITSRRAALNRCLLEGIDEAYSRFPALGGSESAGRERGLSDDRVTLGALEALTNDATAAGFDGVVLVIDELGKILEHAARQTDHGDVFLLQELAEYANRSSEVPLLVLGVLHQGFEQYSDQLDLMMRREWAKVQGRYTDIAFIEPPEQLIRLAAESIATSEWVQLAITDSALDAAEVGAVGASPGLRLGPRAVDQSELFSLFKKGVPLHPVVLVALPYLFRRLAQNERSLFSYLLSSEPFGVREFVKERPDAWVRVPDLFDYVAVNLIGGIQRHPIHQRWLEVSHKLGENPDLTQTEVDIVKTIGVLGVLVEGSHLQANSQLISYALSDQIDDDEVRQAIQALSERSIIVHRRFDDSYRVWEGSDVDIAARMDEGRSKTAGQFGLADALRQYLPPQPIVARRHSYESGTLRFFSVSYLDSVPSEEDSLTADADGVIACCLPINSAQAERFQQWSTQEDLAGRYDVLVAIPEQIGQLRETASELAALHWVRENTPSLRDDRVARRELDARTAEIEREVAQHIQRLMDPREPPNGTGCAWYWRGAVQLARNPRAVSELQSRVMDRLYHQTPRIRNELINRRSLSSAAAAARRNIIEWMLESGDREQLGITGFPPERAIYESVLRSTGIHIQNENGSWGFSPPDRQNDRSNLYPAWQEMERLVFEAVAEPLLIKSLFERLNQPPFGVVDGVLPILYCAFHLVHRDATSLYREGTFLPEPSVADFEILMRRPELFAAGGVRVSGARKVVIDRLARSLNTEPALLPVVRALLKMVNTLPEHAWRTRKLPADVIKVRDVFARARAPERLLFADLPIALGMSTFAEDSEEIDEQLIDRYFERLNGALTSLASVTPDRLVASRDVLLENCGIPAGSVGFQKLREQARELVATVSDQHLKPFLSRLSSDQDDASALESTVALLASRPPRTWNDSDEERFSAQSRFIGNRFREVAASNELLTDGEEMQRDQIIAELRKRLDNEVPAHVARAALLVLLKEQR